MSCKHGLHIHSLRSTASELSAHSDIKANCFSYTCPVLPAVIPMKTELFSPVRYQSLISISLKFDNSSYIVCVNTSWHFVQHGLPILSRQDPGDYQFSRLCQFKANSSRRCNHCTTQCDTGYILTFSPRSQCCRSQCCRS